MDGLRVLDRVIRNLDARLRRVETREDVQEPWAAATLVGSWTNVGAPYPNAQYWRHHGVVSLRGRITGGAIPSTAFTLPVGFRPDATLVVGNVQVANTGVVTVLSGSSPVTLDGVQFRAGA